MKAHRKTLFRVVSLLLTLALLLPISGPVSAVPSVYAVTQSEIDDLKEQADDLDNQREQLQQQLKEIQSDKSKALEQKELLEQQINAAQAEINNIQSQIDKYSELISLKEEELAQAEAEEAELYDQFCKRVRYMEEEGEISYWSILFGSDDFSDLLDNFIMVEEFIQYDNDLMNGILALQDQIAADKADLETSKADQETAKARQVEVRSELQSQQDQVDALIDEISGQEDLLEQQEAKLRSAANAMDEEIKRLEKEMADQISNVVSESGFQWPLPSSWNTLSSLFGSRTHPITGRPNNHTGIDIPASRNTEIYAAKSGVVVTSTYNSSYGNYVVVSHSDGTSTLYAHMNRRNATVGQTVSQGQVIGYVGTTGSSTGNHLHFEIRVNGSRVDPVNYFPDKTLYVRSGGQTVVLPH